LDLGVFFKYADGLVDIYHLEVAQTPVQPNAPDKDQTFFCYAARVRIAALHKDHFLVVKIVDQNRFALTTLVSVAQLATLSVSPAVDFAICCECHGVV
jgi:hypothetical protein